MEISSTSTGERLRVISTTDNGQATIAFFNYDDMRSTLVGHKWVFGINCWGKLGFTIGENVLNSCLNINLSGDVYLAYNLFVKDINILTTLNLKADASNVYTKTAIDTTLATMTTNLSGVVNCDFFKL